MTITVTMKEKLILARALIENEDSWTQEDMATDKDGRGVDPSSPSAVCFCAVGAVDRVLGPTDGWTAEYQEAIDLLSKATRKVKPSFRTDQNTILDPIIQFNDRPRTKHEDILKIFDVAIEAAP